MVLSNSNNEGIKVPQGTKIAQLVFEQAILPDIQVVDELSTTERGRGGFGSTDMNESYDFVSKYALILDDESELLDPTDFSSSSSSSSSPPSPSMPNNTIPT